MAKEKIQNNKPSAENKEPMRREEKMFKHMPVWKSLLIMSIPAMIIMLVFGMYTFADSVLSINLASEHYKPKGTFSTKSLVRLFMSGVTPVTTFMLAITLLFGVGLSKRYSINIGAGKEERAIKTIKTNTQFAMILSVVLIPILLLTAKPWIRSQFEGDPRMAEFIADKAYDYVWIIIISLPLQMFNQIISSLFRAEAKNKQAMAALILPIFINLLFDYIFMGPLGMGIEGGAWATFISYSLTTVLIVAFMLTMKETRIKFKNVFGVHGIQFITIIGTLLVGVAPFMRNMAQSITQTVEMRQIQNVSQEVYGNSMQMSLMMTAVFPIFGLFFPIMFGFIQAGSPISGYNYGAGNMKKVKQATLYIVLYSTIAGIFIFIVSAFLLFNPLADILGIENKNFAVTEFFVPDSTGTLVEDPKMHSSVVQLTQEYTKQGSVFVQVPMKDSAGTVVGRIWVDQKHIFNTLHKARNMYGIMMGGALFFGPALGAMSLFGSTDRVILNILASSLRGLILLFPFLFIFVAISGNTDYDVIQNTIGDNGVFTREFLFWWFYPSLACTSSLILFTLSLFTLKNLDKSHKPLEDRLEAIHQWNKNRIARKAK